MAKEVMRELDWEELQAVMDEAARSCRDINWVLRPRTHRAVETEQILSQIVDEGPKDNVKESIMKGSL